MDFPGFLKINFYHRRWRRGPSKQLAVGPNDWFWGRGGSMNTGKQETMLPRIKSRVLRMNKITNFFRFLISFSWCWIWILARTYFSSWNRNHISKIIINKESRKCYRVVSKKLCCSSFFFLEPSFAFIFMKTFNLKHKLKYSFDSFMSAFLTDNEHWHKRQFIVSPLLSYS